MTFPREGKFTSSHFFASKDVMGNAFGRRAKGAQKASCYKIIQHKVF